MMGTTTRRNVRDRKPALVAALTASGALLLPGLAAADMPDWVMPTWYQALGAPTPALVPTKTPARIDQYEAHHDPTGLIASYQPAGPTITASNAFFTAFGNGRSCFSCHQPQDGWALTPDTVMDTFIATMGHDAAFAPVDGADCPDLATDDDVDPDEHGHHDHDHDHDYDHDHDFFGQIERFVGARKQLFRKANFRIFLPVPKGAEWTVSVVADPYGCETSTTYGLPAGFLSFYRRPLPSSNTFSLDPQGNGPSGIFPDGFNIMWDAREPNLESQFADALRVHAQVPTTTVIPQALIEQGVTFQDGLFTAQAYDNRARDLDAAGADGGPRVLSTLPPGIPSVLINPQNPQAFTPFSAWANLPHSGSMASTREARESIARGQALFDGGKKFNITDVPGLNDVVGQNPQLGFCGFCHNNQDRGNDFFLDPKRLGIEDNSCEAPNGCGGAPGSRVALPNQGDEPRFSFICPKDSILFFTNPVRADGTKCMRSEPGCDYDEFLTSDPGLGYITGKCEDLGKMKVPILRGLASRAPYFHDGRARTLEDLVDFYDTRFAIGFTNEEKRDLIAFLDAL